MIPARQPRRSLAAFSLLEVLLAVTILAVVMTAVYATWSAGLAGWKRSSNVSQNFQRERIVMDTLAELNKSIVYFQSKDLLYSIIGAHDPRSGDSISFVTASDALLPAGEAIAAGMRRVTISLQVDADRRTYLAIANAAAVESPDAPEVTLHVLSAEVSGFAVRYRNPQTGVMDEKWEDPNLLPVGIEYTVTFGANDGRTPPVVVTRTIELSIAEFVLTALGQPINPLQPGTEGSSK